MISPVERFVPVENTDFVRDTKDDRYYFTGNNAVLRTKCTLLAVATPVVYALAAVVNTLVLGGRLLFKTTPLLEEATESGSNAALKKHFYSMGVDLLKVIVTPLTISLLVLSALIGLVDPIIGRECYGAVEKRLGFSDRVFLAPCFQKYNEPRWPGAEDHLSEPLLDLSSGRCGVRELSVIREESGMVEEAE